MTQLSLEYSNEKAFSLVISSLFTVSSRRTSDSFAALALSSIIDSLKSTYSFDFLNYVSLSENDIKIDGTVLKDVESDVLVSVFDSIIRVVYTDLDETAGLFFIKELKDEIGSSLVTLLHDNGLNFDMMALEQRHLQRRRSEKKKQEQHELIIDFNQEINEEKTKNMLSLISSSDVSSCQINLDDHTCVFIDRAQNRLPKYHIDFVLRSFVGLVKKQKSGLNEITFSNKTIFSFLKLLDSNDQVSINNVQKKFDFSTAQVDQLIRHLIRKKYVRYKTISKLVITDIGKKFIQNT